MWSWWPVTVSAPICYMNHYRIKTDWIQIILSLDPAASRYVSFGQPLQTAIYLPPPYSWNSVFTHCGLVTGLGDDLSPVQYQAITNGDLLSIRHHDTNASEILIKMAYFSVWKRHFNLSPTQYQPVCFKPYSVSLDWFWPELAPVLTTWLFVSMNPNHFTKLHSSRYMIYDVTFKLPSQKKQNIKLFELHGVRLEWMVSKF